MRRMYLPPAGVTPRWHVTTIARGGEVLSHATADDLKEAQIVATLEREKSLSNRIWVRQPNGEGFDWA